MAINDMSPSSGRMLNEKGEVVNIADFLDKSPKSVTFQNASIAVGPGLEYVVQPGDSSITLELTGTATAVIVNFEGSSISGTYYPIMGSNPTTLSIDKQATNLNQLWQVDISGLTKFRARISSLSGGGNVTVVGQVNK